jgi:hypothetical protein
MGFFSKIKAEQKKNESETKEERRIFWQPFLDHPLLFTALIISGFLSFLAGWFIGLGVRVEDGILIYKSDVPHIFAAVMYSAAFPYFFEFGLANWLHKLLTREPDNKAQAGAAFFMVFATGLGTAYTAYSTADIIATGLGFFEVFTAIPENVQRWIVYSLPTMLILNIVAGEVYRQFSQEAKLLRIAQMHLREKRIEADTEVKIAQMNSAANIQIIAAAEFAKKAEIEADGIGKDKGQNLWNKERVRYQPEQVFASSTQAIDNVTITPANPQTEQGE